LGLALLHVQHDSSAAREVFEQGIQADPRNVVNYFGSVAASALLGKSPQTRVQTLERYPDLKHMPTPLVYELALNRAEAGDFNSALELFHDRFFGREEGGTNVRQVWIEVNLLRAQALAKKNECTPAVGAVEQLASPVPGMAFTQDGMETFANTARANYVRGEVLAACGKLDQASRYFAASSRATATTGLLWAWAAVRRQTGFDAAQWQTR